MNSQKKFENFDGVLRREALLKSALSGISVGGALAAIAATVSWFFDFNGLILSLLIFLGVAAVGTFVFYKTLFLPSVIKNARRLDRYGLDERLVTMVELEGDNSYIAQKQREDAIANLHRLDAKKIKFKISTLIIVLAIVFGALFARMLTVEVLSAADVIPTGSEVWEKLFPPEPPEKYEVIYTVGKGGYLIGEDEQTVIEGEDAEKVLAVSEDGYMFLAWSDGDTNPSRQDKNVTKNLSVSAIFIEVEEKDGSEDDGDEPDDVPGDSGPGGENPSQSDSGGGKYEEINQIIDGETYYRDVYGEYYERLLSNLTDRDDLTDEEREIIEAYFNIIK